MFDGDKDKFDNQVIRLVDKLEEDNNTFRKEYSQMAVINSLTTSLPQEILSSRYNSLEHPFSNIAKMVATLAATYYNTN